METDDLHSEVSKLQLLIQEEEQKMTKYKVIIILSLRVVTTKNGRAGEGVTGQTF